MNKCEHRLECLTRVRNPCVDRAICKRICAEWKEVDWNPRRGTGVMYRGTWQYGDDMTLTLRVDCIGTRYKANNGRSKWFRDDMTLKELDDLVRRQYGIEDD